MYNFYMIYFETCFTYYVHHICDINVQWVKEKEKNTRKYQNLHGIDTKKIDGISLRCFPDSLSEFAE